MTQGSSKSMGDVKVMSENWKKKRGVKVVILVVMLVIAAGVLLHNEIMYQIFGAAKVERKFQADIDGDGIKEKIQVINNYRNTKNLNQYITNFLIIYVDDQKVYSSKLPSNSPLRKPKIKDYIDDNTTKKQLYFAENGGKTEGSKCYYFVHWKKKKQRNGVLR